jgi:hypothetical protein
MARRKLVQVVEEPLGGSILAAKFRRFLEAGIGLQGNEIYMRYLDSKGFGQSRESHPIGKLLCGGSLSLPAF